MTTVVAQPASETRVLSLIGIGHFLSHFYILCLPPMLPIFAREFEVGFAMLGGAIAGYSWIGGVLQAPVGVLLDKIGARQMLAAGLGLNAAAIAAIGLADGFWSFALFAVLAGVGNAVFHPVDYAIIAAKVQEKRLGRAYSLHTFSGFFGGGVAPVAMVALAAAFDWRMAFIVVGIAGLIAAAVILVQGDALAGERAEPKAQAAGAKSRSVLLTAPVLLYFLFLAVYGLATGGIGSQGVVAMVQMGLTDEAGAAQVLSAYQFAIAAGILAGGVIAERFERHGLTAAICLLFAAALMVLPPVLSPQGVMLFAIFIASGFGFGAVLPARDLMVRAITPPGGSGRVFGFVFVGLSIGSGLAGVVFGALVDAGGAAWVFPAAGGLLVVAVVITTLAQIAADRSAGAA
ncbi:MAG: MFS transporter [Alphaproteobacteria bacterium]|nr:MFS transporter [Alphaproteobacteria bacterium]